MVIGQRNHPAINIITEFKAMDGARRDRDQLPDMHGKLLVVKTDVCLPVGDVEQLKQVGVAVRFDVPVMQARSFGDAFKVKEFRFGDRLGFGGAVA